MDASEHDGSGFADALLRLTRAMLDAARAQDWDTLVALTQQRTDLIDSPAGRRPPQPGTEAVWREAERLNREVLQMTETELRQLGSDVKSVRNQQRLRQSYGG